MLTPERRCNNCEQLGHLRKECPEPTNWAKVKCSNCQQTGHGKKRCPLPPQEDDEEAAGGAAETSGGGDWGAGNGADGGW